ncbi:gamma-glutamylcysteine synthetase [Salmonella enterica subsp. enterica serovar Paratyphi A]|nr:gamma-glutamylcysteine synthetase [Salmonella enterica subsp. enterica serovar Paratyphi A]
MIPDVSQALAWLEKHPQALKGIQRGLERETLRVNADGTLATTGHPEALGSALTHKWITTDFAEALLEFITPVDGDIQHMLTFMRDLHRYTARKLGDERMWPLSMPCYIAEGQDIELAQYGTSNTGRFKTLYREGLKNRYGALMQTISGVHYNFSLPMAFWQAKCGVTEGEAAKEKISAGYFRLIRNYYRFGWVIPYLFGASPAICSSFLQGKPTTLPFEKTDCGMYYLPYATSLRLSDLGYTNKSQSNLGITFNDLHEYVAGLKRAIKTPSEEYARIGVEKDGKRLQINSNVLQIENELYAPIRPKRVTRSGESPSDALLRGGIEYIEVRSLDINPFSPIGVDEQQVRFLDLFMVWCVLADAPEMSSDELLCTRTNWNRVILEGRKPGLTLGIGCETAQFPLPVILEGRKPGLTLGIGCETAQFPLPKVGKDLFRDLKRVAQTLDSIHGGEEYQKVCDELVACFDNPELTFSARILRSMIDEGIGGTGKAFGEAYRNLLREEPLEILQEEEFIAERDASVRRQQEIEAADTEPFAAWLAKHA